MATVELVKQLVTLQNTEAVMEVCGPLRMKPPLHVVPALCCPLTLPYGVSMALFTSYQCYQFHVEDVRRLPSD